MKNILYHESIIVEIKSLFHIMYLESQNNQK